MIVPHEITNELSHNAAVSRHLAIVLVSPPWSVYSVRARTIVADAVKELTIRDICRDDDFFILIDDDPANKNPFWLWLGFPDNPTPPVDVSVCTGAGSVIWLRDGQIVQYEFSANHIGVSGLITKTIEAFTENAT